MQPVLPVLIVPKEVTPEHVHVAIVDTPGGPDQVDRVDEELAQADVVVLVYTVDSESCTSRIPSYWLPKFRSQGLRVPIILVGNKIDTRGGISDPSAAAKMEAFIKPIMDNFREVDVCIECSAKTVSNISEVFYFAQKAVLYPTGPVYDVEEQSLTAAASSALRRIFKLCDKDGDGGLSDKELNDFQFTCFGVYLADKELEGVKTVVQKTRPADGLNRDGSLSAEGFIFLHTLFIQKGRLETTWIVLRKFGYDDEMKLPMSPEDKVFVNDDQSVELSASGKTYLSSMFAAADKDADGLLSPSELANLFAVCPNAPFATKVKIEGSRLTRQSEEAGKEEFMSLESFLARWAMYLMDDLMEAMLTLLHMGYVGGLKNAVRVTKSRKRDRYVRSVSREVINIGVLGAEGGLKSDVVRGLVGVAASGVDEDEVTAAGVVKDAEEEQKVLVMRNVPEGDMDGLFGSRARLEKIDMMVLVFDGASADSYEKARLLWVGLEGKKPGVRMPVVFVACVGGVEGDSTVLESADLFCEERGLPTPVRVSPLEGEFESLYENLLGVAQFPQVACPDYYGGEEERSAMSDVGKVAIGVVVAGIAVYGAKRLYDYYSSRPSS